MSGSHNRGKGKGIAFLRENVAYAGVGCLTWPMMCDDKGYGIVGLNNRAYKAARLMCEMVKGKPPTPKHECAHSCGRGNKGCIDPRHVSWKTRSQNQRDRREHGTHGKPGCDRRAKLTIEQINEIRAAPQPVNKLALSRKYGCTPSNIAKILNGERWQSGKGHLSPLPAGWAARIRALKGKQNQSVTAEQFGLGRGSIWRIQNGEAPKSVYLKRNGIPSR